MDKLSAKFNTTAYFNGGPGGGAGSGAVGGGVGSSAANVPNLSSATASNKAGGTGWFSTVVMPVIIGKKITFQDCTFSDRLTTVLFWLS